MIKISKHISQTIEAPFLDASVNYFAKLWCEEREIVDEPVAVGVVEEIDDEAMVTFTFSKEQIDKFDDGDKLNLTVWNTEHTQDWRARNMFRVVESHVGEEEQEDE